MPANIESLLDEAIITTPSLEIHRESINALMTKAYNIGFSASLSSASKTLELLDTKMDTLLKLQSKPPLKTYADKVNSSLPIKEFPQAPPLKSTMATHILLAYPVDPTKSLSETNIKKTVDTIRSKCRILRLHKIKKGGILIESASSDELAKIKEVLSNDAELKLRTPYLRTPELRVKNIDPSLPEEEILPLLISQNRIMTEEKELIKTCFSVKTKFKRRDLIIRVANPLHNKLLKTGNLFLNYSRHTIMENFFIKTCKHCLNTGHLPNACPKKDEPSLCYKCGEDHKSDQCKSPKSNCWRCTKYSATKSPVHKYGSENCILYQNELKRLQTITNYNV